MVGIADQNDRNNAQANQVAFGLLGEVADNFCHFNRIGFFFDAPLCPDRHSPAKTSEDSPAKLSIWAVRPPPASSGLRINPNSEQKGLSGRKGHSETAF
jgi:hypothetical protein